MKRYSISALYALAKQGELKDGQAFDVAGFVKTARFGKNVSFIELNDGSSFKNIQIVILSDSACHEVAQSASVGAALKVHGNVVLTPEASQPFELSADEVVIEGECPPDYPLQKKRHGADFLRTIPHLRMRTNIGNAVFRLRSGLAFALHEFFNKNGFIYVHTPIITGNDCEGAGEMFRVTTLPPDGAPKNDDGEVDFTQDFFGGLASLTVSGQLEAEGAAQALGKVYTFGPTFRAENSNTPRHAAEFWMLEPEIAFADLVDDMQLAEDMLRYVVDYALQNYIDELEFLDKFVEKGLIERLRKLTDRDYVRITYTDAVEKLQQYNDSFDYKVSWGADLQTEHERCLTEKIFNGPVFVTDYPLEIKSFYMRQNDDGKTVAAMDLLVPGVGELIGGSQREERYDRLLSRMQALDMPTEPYKWYLDLRRFGTTTHAGFGLGFERLVMLVTGVSNIRDVCFFPRTTGRF